MPRPLSWLPRLAEIRRSVTGSVRTHYDRPAIENLFLMQPRAAGKLMAVLPQVEALGKSHLVERAQLQKFLDEIAAAPDTAAVYTSWKEKQRKISRRKPRVLYRKDLLTDGQLIALPSAVKLTPGRLEIQFDTLQELVESLALVAGCLSNDEQEFENRYVPEKARTEAQLKADRERHDIELLLEDLRSREAEKRRPPTSAGHQMEHHTKVG